MVEYIKLKPGDELWKAEILNEQTLFGMLTDEQFSKIEDGRCMELKGVCFMQRPPFYGISPQIDYEKNTPYIELIESFDVNYLMQERGCEAVFNSIDYADQIVDLHKMIGRFSRDIEIVKKLMDRRGTTWRS
ncbi:hypothetical protein EAI89_05470 [Eubacterium sp. am_0171]|uniref:Uncharacterized protein n=1 Tax=Faecalicatena contorta TaxID=39482 RepID=A0A174BY39_9FIRM|nr:MULTISPECIES: hypothetical protein [Clostridia]MSC83158.1 hypothetical protein [Eubacterium sp. BIOML-A1]MSD05646.1 hypothetical protein [Eubacterium sp. BIOML-A2]RYT24544.1 hypothetical protein EAI89_05470 [Eubacterium sp. am_0171]CUO05527.1 Uncharacterised protein [[Eubacterium] contortum] [Faecalicatena contorta]